MEQALTIWKRIKRVSVISMDDYLQGIRTRLSFRIRSGRVTKQGLINSRFD